MSDHLKRLKLKGWILALWVFASVMFLTTADPNPSTAAGSAALTGPSFIEFESGQVRPIAMSRTGPSCLQ